VPEETKSIWYRFIHDIIPTNELLHNIRLAACDHCKHCEKQDTFEHRLTEYGDGTEMLDWTRLRLTLMLLSDWPEYQQKGPFALSSNNGPTKTPDVRVDCSKLRCRMQQQITLTPHDYLDILRRANWKTYQATGRIARVGNYLEVF
jgi:hypothetical protein